MSNTTYNFTGKYDLPPNKLFQYSEIEMNDEDAKDIARTILYKLASLKISANVVDYTVGVTTTTIYLQPADNVRMSRFKTIEDDLSIATGAKCRVIAPVYNTNYVAVEVPTKDRQIIRFGNILDKGVAWDKVALPVSLGIKTDGTVLGFDLADIPHLLIAGASGQGKSVCLNVIINSLLCYKSPSKYQLILIDPKKVEFSSYEPLKPMRMVSEIRTEPSDAVRELRGLCRHMDYRFSEMKAAGVRKLSDYNKIEGKSFSYVVCIVDEFSDLMMSDYGKEVEQYIIKIAQLGRAAGIHLIIATQRPDADVITGLIKANFPARIAFRTSTGTDSRIIIDRNGAEKLTGNGDMLFLHNGETTRAQCAYISDNEINSVVEHWLKQRETLNIEEEKPVAAPIFISEPEIKRTFWGKLFCM